MWQAFADVSFTGDKPNHILALAYTKACAGKGIALTPIKRQGAGYHSKNKSHQFASATAIRKHLSDKAFVDKSVPDASLLLTSPQVSWDNYFQLLTYQILTHADLTQIVQVNEELANRISAAIQTVETIGELIDQVATKRYTKARVRRVLTYILVNAMETSLPEAVHVLGFSDKGRVHLKSLKQRVSIVSRIGSEPWDALTQQADAIYQLGNPAMAEQTWGRWPIMRTEK